ncbi:hypothetical protein JB92DRAFT_2826459 [Gautieria morchelliformis]|nr:hypothetical protein JB92DRAFT_2826459 [Gautieria morchelliformis]
MEFHQRRPALRIKGVLRCGLTRIPKDPGWGSSLSLGSLQRGLSLSVPCTFPGVKPAVSLYSTLVIGIMHTPVCTFVRSLSMRSMINEAQRIDGTHDLQHASYLHTGPNGDHWGLFALLYESDMLRQPRPSSYARALAKEQEQVHYHCQLSITTFWTANSRLPCALRPGVRELCMQSAP